MLPIYSQTEIKIKLRTFEIIEQKSKTLRPKT